MGRKAFECFIKIELKVGFQMKFYTIEMALQFIILFLILSHPHVHKPTHKQAQRTLDQRLPRSHAAFTVL